MNIYKGISEGLVRMDQLIENLEMQVRVNAISPSGGAKIAGDYKERFEKLAARCDEIEAIAKSRQK